MTDWAEIITQLNLKAPAVKKALVLSRKKHAIEIKYYYCGAISDLVDFIRKKTKAKELGATHHVLKALFRWVVYRDGAQLEVSKNQKRIDILVDGTQQAIEVKTLSEMKVYELWKKAMAVLESDHDHPDILWIFYFYRVLRPDRQSPPDFRKYERSAPTEGDGLAETQYCHYLLTYININVMQQDNELLKQDLITLVEESLKEVAKKIGRRPELIIPLENLIKVEDLERLVEEKEGVIADVIAEKERSIAEKDKIIARKEREIEELKRKLT